MPTRLGVHGAGGRMGQRVVALAHADENFDLLVTLENENHPQLGNDAGTIAGVGEIGLPLVSKLETEVDVIIDFSLPEAAVGIAKTCVEWKTPLVMATTGLDDKQKQEILAVAHEIPLLWAPNMSLAVNLLMKLSTVTAAALREQSVDVEIIERHHRFKEDAPSGTALRFGELIAQVMGQTDHVHGRHGRPVTRKPSEIGYHALRVGDNPGEHTIVFGLLGETIELTVKASSRDCYARGALAAARFLEGKNPGTYSMEEVLGLQ